MHPQINTPHSKKLYRILLGGWFTRQELAEEMFMSEHQITGLTIRLREKGIRVLTKASRRRPGYTEYSIEDYSESGDMEPDPRGSDPSVRSVSSVKNMLITEMNRIRLEAKSKSHRTIENMALLALQAAGLDIDPD